MIKIRKGTFETNSSSTHAICIPKENFSDDYLPDSCWTYKNGDEVISFKLDYFGWEWKQLDAEKCADYLYTYMFCILNNEDFKDGLQKIIKCLHKRGIKAKFEKSRVQDRDDFRWYKSKKTIGIDHSETLDSWYDILINDDQKLWNFLCYGRIFTGNDNESFRMPDFENEKYWSDNYELFEKGN